MKLKSIKKSAREGSDVAAKEEERVEYPQSPCLVCGAMVDLPALWVCPCGLFRLCYRSPCHFKIPFRHRDGICKEENIHTAAETLLADLRAAGFTFRVSEDGKLLCSPLSKLTPMQLQAIKASREEIIGILTWEAAEPQCTDATLRAWYEQVENPPTLRPELRPFQ